MGRGLFSGLIWGAFIMLVVVTLLSLSAPLPDRPAPVAAAMDGGDVVTDVPDAGSDMPVGGGDEPAPTPTEAQAASTGPVSEIPLPAGSEFNRPPEEQEAALPAIDVAPATGPTVLTQLAEPEEPSLSITSSAPQPVATVQLQGPTDAGGVDVAAAVPSQSDDPQPPEVQPAPLGLPTVGAEPAAQASPEPQGLPLQRITTGEDTASAVTVPEAPLEISDDLPAIEANAASFFAAETRPLMAVILIDDPSFPLGRSALTRFDFPVTFAIDPTREDAAEAAAEYRAAGFEVVLLAEGFDSGNAADLLATGFTVLPEAVAVLDTATSVIQSDRTLLEGVVEVLAETGHGLVAYPRGLNVAEQTATRASVPAETLFREIDEARERATVITRYLDRAAFAAGQEGQVIVVGHTYSDTVTALFSWALGTRSEGVALAPLSAVLTR